jgi:hypothetical protein
MTTFEIVSEGGNVILYTNNINDSEIKYLEKLCLINDILYDKNETSMKIDHSKIELLYSLLKEDKNYQKVLRTKSL